MRPLYLLSALGLSCTLLAAPPVTAQTYTVKDLGVLAPNLLSEANGINESGQVTGFNGYFIDGTIGESEGFLYQDGKMSPIGSAADRIFSGNGIAGDDKAGGQQNDEKRKIRVTGSMLVLPSGAGHAFLYQDHYLRDLGLLPGGDSSSGQAVNTSGEVVGGADDANFITQPFLWKHGNMIALPTGGTLGGFAASINEQGDVAGFVNLPEGYTMATLFRHDQAIPLGFLPGGNESYATAINDALQIAGTASVPGFVLEHAFLWEKGKLLDLGVLPNGTTSEALGINAWGEVVGTANVTSPDQVTIDHAFLYSQGKMHDLNDMISSKSGWLLETASSINSKGEIVGTGIINGDTRAFRLTLDCNDHRNRECEPCKNR
jgi:probable HAF family extracellular repeat protein